MLGTPSIVEVEETTVAAVRIDAPRSEIQPAMRAAIAALESGLRDQGVEATGPRFTLHHRMDGDRFDCDVGRATARAVQAAGRLAPATLPAGTIARVVYQGGYEGLGAAWGEFRGWLRQHGHRPAEELWEVYLSGPESGGAPTEWRTELNQPLKV